MEYGTISEQERSLMKDGDRYISLYLHDNYEDPAGSILVGRFHNEDEALKAVHDYVRLELGGYFSDDFELRFYRVSGEDSIRHKGWKKARCYESYFI